MKSPYTLLAVLYVVLILLATQGCGQPFKGRQGDPGASGRDSGPCTVVRAAGVSTVTCPDGTQVEIPDGENGASGQPGADGPQGPKGVPGNNGADATPVTAIQFCPGYTTVYPSTFPEFGLCLSGTLFAVYWDNHNAWFAEIVIGYYASTSTTAPCNFTVGPNCIISPQPFSEGVTAHE